MVVTWRDGCNRANAHCWNVSMMRCTHKKIRIQRHTHIIEQSNWNHCRCITIVARFYTHCKRIYLHISNLQRYGLCTFMHFDWYSRHLLIDLNMRERRLEQFNTVSIGTSTLTLATLILHWKSLFSSAWTLSLTLISIENWSLFALFGCTRLRATTFLCITHRHNQCTCIVCRVDAF